MLLIIMQALFLPATSLEHLTTRKMLMALILLLLLLLLFLSEAYDLQRDTIAPYCDFTSEYVIPSRFKANLDILLSKLPDHAANSNNLYFNDSAGTAPAIVYGLAECRLDMSAYDCGICLYRSALHALSQCLPYRTATIISDKCTLRYSELCFFSEVSLNFITIQNLNNVSNPTVFSQPLRNLMHEVLSKAPMSVTRFASSSFNDSMIGDIYGLAGCSRDLTEAGCSTCLNQALPHLLEVGYSKGCRVFSLTCHLRFEIYPILAKPPPPAALRYPNDRSVHQGSRDDTMKMVLAVVLSLIVALLLASVTYFCLQTRRKTKKLVFLQDLQDDETDFTGGESQWFELSTIKDATDNFANQNKLGQGGFGPVYKGTLKDGQDIAVKRLSANSGQGFQELRNEVVFVAKLQHRNLVRLLGCCLENNEKLLVYEYLPNSSLDKFLFDDHECQRLDWSSRYKIVEGIARGLLYLHEDSRLRIIHRDLKASNILLDANMNPKISDFGLAKHFGLNETQANTTRIAGTHGYMAPEYLMRGEFSPKSDVFSYGVLVLEIVTGRKNRGVVRYQPASDLVNSVWKNWNEGKALELTDKRIGEEFPVEQVLSCIHIGLLCVQEDPTKRPSMALVVNMLSSYSTSLPMPLIPGFFRESSCIMESDEYSGNADILLVERKYGSGSTAQLANLTSTNEISMTDMEPR